MICNALFTDDLMIFVHRHDYKLGKTMLEEVMQKLVDCLQTELFPSHLQKLKWCTFIKFIIVNSDVYFIAIRDHTNCFSDYISWFDFGQKGDMDGSY